jgi:hypothetical protein
MDRKPLSPKAAVAGTFMAAAALSGFGFLPKPSKERTGIKCEHCGGEVRPPENGKKGYCRKCGRLYPE